MEGKRSIGLTGDWDGRINRRTLLRTGGSAAAGLFVLGRTVPVKAAPPFAGDPFSLGVASGDPTPDGIVLWTRLAPEPLEGGGLKDERLRRALRGCSGPGLPRDRTSRRGGGAAR